MILWWEALLLLLTYVCYVLFMKINASAERTVTKFLYKNKVTRVRSTDHLVPGVSLPHKRLLTQMSLNHPGMAGPCLTFSAIGRSSIACTQGLRGSAGPCKSAIC